MVEKWNPAGRRDFFFLKSIAFFVKKCIFESLKKLHILYCSYTHKLVNLPKSLNPAWLEDLTKH